MLFRSPLAKPLSISPKGRARDVVQARDVVEDEEAEVASHTHAQRTRVKGKSQVHLMAIAKRRKMPPQHLNPSTTPQANLLPHRQTLPSKEAPPRRNAHIVEDEIAVEDKAKRKVESIPHKRPPHRKNK